MIPSINSKWVRNEFDFSRRGKAIRPGEIVTITKIGYNPGSQKTIVHFRRYLTSGLSYWHLDGFLSRYNPKPKEEPMTTMTICDVVNRNGGSPTVTNFYFRIKQDPLDQGQHSWVVKAPSGYQFWYGRDLLLGQKIEVEFRWRYQRGINRKIPVVNWNGIDTGTLTQLILVRENLQKRRDELFSVASSGGHLGAARSWMQSKCRNGERVQWGSLERLEKDFTVADVEEVARVAARATLEETIRNLLPSFRDMLKSDSDKSFRINISLKELEDRYQEEIRRKSRKDEDDRNQPKQA